MKDYMAHGGFSIGQSEITANSSFSFLWTIDINKELKQRKGNLFALLPNIFDTAFFDRIHFFLPGWEIPRITNSYLIKTNPVIINHLSHFFHVLFNIGEPFMDLIEKRFKLENSSITNRDNIAIRKNLLGLLKLVFPIGEPNPDEFDQLIHYSIECRRRISEQMVLQEPEIFNLGDYAYLNRNGERIKVFCPESNF